jgi:RNA polymerase sigma-70 factor (ECF subfamily)
MGFENTNQQANEKINYIASKFQDCSITERQKNELVELIYPKLKYFVWTFCRNEDDTLEALQWSLKKIFKNIDKFDFNKAKFTTWIYTITRNETLFYLYKKNQNPTVSLEYMGNGGDPSIEYDSDGVQSEIDHLYSETVLAINQIEDVTLRNIAIDKMIKNEKIKEISVKYDINENTVKTKLRKIRIDVRDNVLLKNPEFKETLNHIFDI